MEPCRRDSGVRAIVAALAALALCGCGGGGGGSPAAPPPPPPADPAFADPRAVAISGYSGEAMEPFLSRDGTTLFFNNKNDPPAQTELHWATRVDDLNFQYRGLIGGANQANELDGVASMSTANRFCFISPRSYAATLATVHCGAWDGAGNVGAIVLQTAASPQILGRLVFDAEIDPAGALLYVADGAFSGGAAPDTADLRLARLSGGQFALSPADDVLFAALNTPTLEYAPAISADGLELAFTRLVGTPPAAQTQILIARRTATNLAFPAPMQIQAIQGFVEAPTFSPNGRLLYYHRQVSGRFEIWRVARP